MPDLGKRLAEERKRLGLSQSAFAERAGVSFSSQRRYEDGRSSPDAGYLDTLNQLGVDSQYVLNGIRESESDLYFSTIERLFFILCEQLGAERDQVDSLVNRAFEIERGTLDLEDGHTLAVQQVTEISRGLIDGLDRQDLDVAVLAAILEGIDSSLIAKNLVLSSVKRAQAAAMLYRAFKTGGKVDPAMIDDAVKLAAT